MSENQQLRIVVDPKPSNRKQAAIAAAVVAIVSNVPQDDVAKSVNKWREAGKREALHDSVWGKS